MIRAPRPRVVSVTRHHPGQVTPGDTAEVRLDPGLIAFLENTPAAPSTALGAGYQARYNIPASMAASAAAAVLSPADRADTYWSGRDLEVEWFGAPGPDDIVPGGRPPGGLLRTPGAFRHLRPDLDGRAPLSGNPAYDGHPRWMPRGLPLPRRI